MTKLIKTIPLPEHPENVPSVSLHVMAKNAENVLGRLLDCIRPHVQEFHFILNDTDDGSESVIRSRLANGEFLHLQHVTSANHPELYFQDEPYSYEVGLPLADEKFDGPYTHAPLLCDWAGARNLGWDSNCEWRLFLDADDVVPNPGELPGLLVLLQNLGADVAAPKYVYGRGPGGGANSVSYRERLARNVPTIRWTGATHETLAGGLRNVLVEDRFCVVDMKDNWGRGVRVPGRCFKVLYREARLKSWKVSPRHLLYLMQESPGMMSVEWATNCLLPKYMELATCPEERALMLCFAGERSEFAGDFRAANVYYQMALGEFDSPKAAWRLCRARFMLEDYAGAIEAYERGVALKDVPQVLDDGPIYADSCKVLAGQAYFELGEHERAMELLEEAAKAFPTSEPVLTLRDRMRAVKTTG